MPYVSRAKNPIIKKAVEAGYRKIASSAAKTIQKNYRRKASVRSVQKLTRQVKSIKLQAQGDRQMRRDFVRWATLPAQYPGGVPISASKPCDIRPICFLHQAITPLSQLKTLSLTPAGAGVPATLLPINAGEWRPQDLPVIAAQGLIPADYNRFDQLENWKLSLGVQNKFVHTSTTYTLNVRANRARGYIDVYMLHPKKSYLRSNQKDVTLPNGLVGFTNMSLGDDAQYQPNPQYWTCKRRLRKYFNVVQQQDLSAGNAAALHTNPDFDVTFTVRNKKSRRNFTVPEATGDGTTGILDATDIPFAKQDWIMISTTLQNQDVNEGSNYFKCDLKRVVHYRDFVGASA